MIAPCETALSSRETAFLFPFSAHETFETFKENDRLLNETDDVVTISEIDTIESN